MCWDVYEWQESLDKLKIQKRTQYAVSEFTLPWVKIIIAFNVYTIYVMRCTVLLSTRCE